MRTNNLFTIAFVAALALPLCFTLSGCDSQAAGLPVAAHAAAAKAASAAAGIEWTYGEPQAPVDTTPRESAGASN